MHPRIAERNFARDPKSAFLRVLSSFEKTAPDRSVLIDLAETGLKRL